MDITGPGVLPGTRVIGIGTGLGGGPGTYVVNKSQTFPLLTFPITGASVSFQGSISGFILTAVGVTGTIVPGLAIQGSPTPGFDPTDDIVVASAGPPAILGTKIVTQLSDIGSTPVATATGVTASLGASSITVPVGTTGIAAGQLMEGNGIPQGTFVTPTYTTGTTVGLVDYLGNPV